MADYDLYYWPLPFRGQFLRAILAVAGKSWQEHDSEAVGNLMQQAPADQPAPFMGPPLLVDRSSGFALSQMPAIALYLGETLNLVEDDANARAMTAKIVNDANDVIDELTLDGGREMWTPQKWANFQPRLSRWMHIWEASARRYDVQVGQGYFLGANKAGVADIVTATLRSTMGNHFPAIAALLDETAPRTAGLTRRVQALPGLADLTKRSASQYGEAYCGGEIEKSLRSVLDP